MPLRAHKFMLGFLMSLAWTAGRASELIAYTEESAPYNYVKGGRVVGIATETLQAACLKAKLTCHIQLMPWARAYAMSTSTPNSLIFSIVRRPDREKDFIWLSPIMTEAVWAFGRKDSPPLDRVADMIKRRIGVINGSSSAAFLRDAGVPDSALDPANSVESNFMKLDAKRIDYVVDTEQRMIGKQASHAIKFPIVKVLHLYDVTTYFAMHPASDPALVQAIKAALAEVRSSPLHEQIVRKYRPPGN